MNPANIGKQFVDLYHRTSPEAAEAIRAEGRMVTSHPSGRAWFGTEPEGHISDIYPFRDGVVHVRVPREITTVEHRFPSGEEFHSVMARDLKPEHFVTSEQNKR